jgi:hypothetical protein
LGRVEAWRGIFEGCKYELDNGEEFWSVNIIAPQRNIGLFYEAFRGGHRVAAKSSRLRACAVYLIELKGRQMLVEVINAFNAKQLQIVIALAVVAALVVLASTHFILKAPFHRVPAFD